MTGKVVDRLLPRLPVTSTSSTRPQRASSWKKVRALAMVTHQDTFKAYLKSLRDGLDNKYIVSWRVLNTADFGLPQNRPRLYIIGIKRGVLQGRQLPPFQWPPSVGCVPLASVLESCQVRKQPRPGTVAEKSLQMLQRQLTEKVKKLHACCLGHLRT